VVFIEKEGALTMTRVEGILETCLYVDDLIAAEEFYTRILGIAPFSRVEDRHVFFQLGQSMLLLFNPDQTEKPGGDVPPHGAYGAGHVAFAVSPDNVPIWREHLRQNEVAIEAEVTWPSGGQSLYFRDPSGNSLEVATVRVWGL
jgi:catechol 2,3-dioxygenase-like lactoylglutathione lyase family enzyme